MFEGFWGFSADGAITKPFLKGSQRQSLKCSEALEGTGCYRGESDSFRFHTFSLKVFFPSEHINISPSLVIRSRSSQAMWVTWKKSKVLRSSWWPKNWSCRWWWMSETQVMAGMPETKHEEFGCWEKMKHVYDLDASHMLHRLEWLEVFDSLFD